MASFVWQKPMLFDAAMKRAVRTTLLYKMRKTVKLEQFLKGKTMSESHKAYREKLVEEHPVLDDHEHRAWGKIPGYMRPGITRYILDGIQPGDFLTALFNNDLKEAIGRADETNCHLLWNYVKFLHNNAPATAWGFAVAVTQWMTMHRDKKSIK